METWPAWATQYVFLIFGVKDQTQCLTRANHMRCFWALSLVSFTIYQEKIPKLKIS